MRTGCELHRNAIVHLSQVQAAHQGRVDSEDLQAGCAMELLMRGQCMPTADDDRNDKDSQTGEAGNRYKEILPTFIPRLQCSDPRQPDPRAGNPPWDQRGHLRHIQTPARPFYGVDFDVILLPKPLQ